MSYIKDNIKTKRIPFTQRKIDRSLLDYWKSHIDRKKINLILRGKLINTTEKKLKHRDAMCDTYRDVKKFQRKKKSNKQKCNIIQI